MSGLIDTRPINCRHRQADEGRGHPRSSCLACGKTITTGLGRHCVLGMVGGKPEPEPVPYDPKPIMPLLELNAALRVLARVHLKPDDQLGFSVMIGARPEYHTAFGEDYANAWAVVHKAIGGRF